MKHATIIRLGAIGDAVWTLPVIRELHTEGYAINVHCKRVAASVYKNNPRIKNLFTYPNESGTKVDIRVPNGSRVIDLDKTIEGKYLTDSLPVGCSAHILRYELGCSQCQSNKIRRKVNINYAEEQLAVAGFVGRSPSTLGEIYVTLEDLEDVADVLKNWENKYVILWSLADVYHKQYLDWFTLMSEFCTSNPDVVVYTMGSTACAQFEQEGANIHAGHWTLSQSITLISQADLVIGGETGPMNIASCFDVAKLLFLSHSSRDNISKHWTNTLNLLPTSECHPCYQLHRKLDSCPTKPTLTGNIAPICTVDIDKIDLLNTIKKIKTTNHDNTQRSKF